MKSIYSLSAILTLIFVSLAFIYNNADAQSSAKKIDLTSPVSFPVDI